MPAQTKEEALRKYAEIIRKPCPECGKPAGKLCDTRFAWVCAGRFQIFDPASYPLELWL